MSNIISRICSVCQTEKPIDEFYKDKRGKNGRRSNCKSCQINSSSKYSKKHKEKLKKYRNDYYVKNKDKAIQKAKEWYEGHKEKHKESCRRYRKNNLEKTREFARRGTRKWMLAHPEYRNEWRAKNIYKGRQYNQSRRAKVLENGGEITAKEWKELLDFYGHKCLCCGRTENEVPIHIDHVVPVSKGGRNTIDNAQPLCKSCNSAKHARIIDYRERYTT